MQDRFIKVINARRHNLKGIDVDIPLGKITVITGSSGSGKSTLAMDCLFAEGQFRYLESLGSDIKRLIHLWERPEVDAITHLPPPVAMEQTVFSRTPRSTIATLTDMDDLLRMLLVTSGNIFCPRCQKELVAQSIDEMTERVLSLPNGEKFVILASLDHLLSKLTLEEVISFIKKEGFIRVRLDGEELLLDSPIRPKKTPKSIQVVVDRLIMKDDSRARISDSLTLALRLGSGSARVVTTEGAVMDFSEKARCQSCDITFPKLTTALFSRYYPEGMCPECKGKGCPSCKETGLSEFSRAIKTGGLSYPELLGFSIKELSGFLLRQVQDDTSTLPERGNLRALQLIMQAFFKRCSPILDMGLGYLSLSRPIPTLSGGEFQRLRIASQLGRELSGILYILDEPTVGLHPVEKEALVKHLIKLKEEGNTILVLEHDLNIIDMADHLIELGPGAGEKGGRLIFSGSPSEMKRSKKSITGPYLSGKKTFGRKRKKRVPKGWLKIFNARANNLKDITVAIPMGCMVCITGVSGSGKSSLLMEEIYPAIKKGPDTGKILIEPYISPVNAVIMDQSPVFSSKYSMPATYLGVYAQMRTLFSKTPQAREKGLSHSFFSLAKKGGRCEKCRGQGYIIYDLEFLPPVRSACDICGGMRFNREALEIRYKGLNMADVLALSMAEAASFFSPIPSIRSPLEAAERAGIGYIKLGQPLSTLSGGENQRLRLARELARSPKGHTFYLLDELSRGLHPADLERILMLLDELLDEGHSIIIIEHDTQVLSVSDWIIELGPGGGPDGGRIVREGPT